MFSATFDPKFDAKLIYDEIIAKNWFEIQLRVYELGNDMLSYMQQYITAQIKGKDSTGNLVRSIKLHAEAGAGEGTVAWGIGYIPEMNKIAPYWRLMNYGGSTWHGDYHFVPGFFSGDKFVYNPTIKEGKALPSGVKGVITPMNYIDVTRMQADRELNKILRSLTNKR